MTLRILPRMGEANEEADRFGDYPHPREMLDFVGHGEAERALLDAYRSGRMHHAWVLGGQKGIGKAVLAYRFARFILANPDPDAVTVRSATSLDVDGGRREARLVAGQAHPDLYVLRRNWNAERKTLYSDIRVADVAKVNHLFGSTASAGGWRVTIVDSADDLNANSANALLKIVEEPPARSIFLIVSHAPARLMPTLRSRCRMLSMRPLEPESVMAIVTGLGQDQTASADLENAAMHAGGSIQRAFRNLDADALALRQKLHGLFAQFPSIDQKTSLAIAEEASRRDGAAFEHFIDAAEDYLSAAIAARLTGRADRLLAFADVHEKLVAGRRDAETYNLDKRPLVLATIADMADAVRRADAPALTV